MDLASNPNHLSSEQVRQLIISGQISNENAESVFGISFVNNLLIFGSSKITINDISQIITPSDYCEYTQVYVWGKKRSGKTSVLGSLFATIENECSNVVWKDDETTNRRRKELTDVFNRKHRTLSPVQDQNTHCVQAYNVEFTVRRGIASRKYQFSFIEVNIDSDNYWETLLKYGLTKKANNKIHLLCFDSSKGELGQRNQASSLSQIIQKLESTGVLNTSVGLYLLVTKTDLMIRVPLEYRYEAAQTLITASHRKLWQLVVNSCYKMNIYDATPIPFSVGDTMLKDLLKPDLTRAKVLLQYPILLKSQPCLTFYQRLLRKGNLTITMIVSLVVMASAAYGIYKLIDQIPTAPKDEPIIYNFTDDFLKRESELITNGTNFYSVISNFEKLYRELTVEQSITDVNGSPLHDIDTKCMVNLQQDMSRILEREYLFLFRDSDWGSSRKKYTLKTYSELLLRQDHIGAKERNSLKKYNKYVSNLDEIRSLISTSKNCKSLSNVKYVINNYKQYLTYPYKNDSELNTGLTEAKQNAYKSYAKHLLSKAKIAESEYQARKASISSGFLSLFSGTKLQNLKQSFRQSTSSLRSDIEKAIQTITMSESFEANEDLKKAKNLIDF